MSGSQRGSTIVVHAAGKGTEDESFQWNDSFDFDEETIFIPLKSPQQGRRRSVDTYVSINSVDGSIAGHDFEVENETKRKATREGIYSMIEKRTASNSDSDVSSSTTKTSTGSGDSQVGLRMISSLNGGLIRHVQSTMSARLSITSFNASMPRLISIHENQDSGCIVNESISSFFDSHASNESTSSFIDTSTRTTSSRGIWNSSMPSLLSISDNELPMFDGTNSFVDSFPNDYTIACLHNESIKGNFPDGNEKLCPHSAPSLCQNQPLEGVTKETLSPTCATKSLQEKILEKRLRRWETSAASAAAPNPMLQRCSSPTGGNFGPPSVRPNLLGLLSLEHKPFDDSISDFDLGVQEPNNASCSRRVMTLRDNDAVSRSPQDGDTCPAMAVRFKSSKNASFIPYQPLEEL